MTVFISRFWGFQPEKIPLIMFSSETYRDNLLRDSRSGDIIAYVATKTANSREDERGRLLGLAEIGRRAIDTLAVMREDELPAQLWENGKLRFPKSIPMVRAWRFNSPPPLLEVIERQLPRSATQGAIPLKPADAESVHALAAVEVDLSNNPVLIREREIGDRIGQMFPSRGPVPSSGSRSFEVEGRDFGFVYALQFGDLDVWKIGNSWNPEGRADSFNKNIPYAVIGQKWEVRLRQRTGSPKLAHEIEQRAIAVLAPYSIGGEMFGCGKKELDRAWSSVVMSVVFDQ